MTLSKLQEKSLVLVFAYAPTGLGHLRVTDALYHGLPKDITPILLGSQDTSLGNFYRFVTIHPFTRFLFETMQRGVAENLFVFFYKWYITSGSHTTLLYQQVLTILDQRIDTPKTLLFVATHFGLAHQLAKIKVKLARERGIKVFLVVQITDDSPQHILYVEGADLIFCPSRKTAEGLLSYARRYNLPLVKMIVNSYPISPFLNSELPQTKYLQRVEQLDPKKKSDIHVAIPLSGAAIGTRYYFTLMSILSNPRFKFHIVGKDAPYTRKFLKEVTQLQNVDVHTANRDHDVIDMYEELYKKTVVSLEITKPSEQAFKALLCPNYVGASLLLFMYPVGRQEEDNLSFLRRHHLIPTEREQDFLLRSFEKNISLVPKDAILTSAYLWRGISLPNDPKKAGGFILWLLREGILLRMDESCPKGHASDEINFHGVETFWEKVNTFLEKELRI